MNAAFWVHTVPPDWCTENREQRNPTQMVKHGRVVSRCSEPVMCLMITGKKRKFSHYHINNTWTKCDTNPKITRLHFPLQSFQFSVMTSPPPSQRNCLTPPHISLNRTYLRPPFRSVQRVPPQPLNRWRRGGAPRGGVLNSVQMFRGDWVVTSY